MKCDRKFLRGALDQMTRERKKIKIKKIKIKNGTKDSARSYEERTTAEFLNSVRKTAAGCIGHTYPTRWSKGLYTHMAFVISSLVKTTKAGIIKQYQAHRAIRRISAHNTKICEQRGNFAVKTLQLLSPLKADSRNNTHRLGEQS